MLKTFRTKYANELVLFLIFAVLFIAMSIIAPDRFLTQGNIKNMARQMPEFGLMALAMMAVIVTGGMNLSIITGASLSAILAAMFMRTEWAQSTPGLSVVIGIIMIVLLAVCTGFINGYLVGHIGIVAMLCTLSTQLIFLGLGLVITKGKSVSISQMPYLKIASTMLGPIPLPMVIFVLAAIFSYFMLERSEWGHQLYMVGDNEVATRFSGVNTKKTIMLAYVFSGLMYGMSSVLITSRVCSAKTDYGSSYLMQSVTAVVMGGTSINGGSGTVAGTVLAVMILQVLSTGFTTLRMDQNLVDMFSGVILIFVLGVRYLTKVIIDNRKIKARRAAAAAIK